MLTLIIVRATKKRKTIIRILNRVGEGFCVLYFGVVNIFQGLYEEWTCLKKLGVIFGRNSRQKKNGSKNGGYQDWNHAN